VERSVVGTESSCQQPRWSNTDRSTYRFFSFRWLSPTFDFSFLKTLPVGQVRNGFAELVKIASVGDKAVWDLLCRRPRRF
jgi:hypothetical protein